MVCVLQLNTLTRRHVPWVCGLVLGRVLRRRRIMESRTFSSICHSRYHDTFVPSFLKLQGTLKRTRQQIESEIENMGAQLNAYTSREQTVYYARCLNKDMGRAVDILSDIIQSSTLDNAAIEEERGTILREKEEVEKQMEEVVFDHLHATAYQGTSLGLTILGTDDNINTLQRKDLSDYISNHYTTDRMVLVGAGGVDHAELCKLGETAFSSLRKASSSGKVLLPKKAEFTGSEIRIRDDTMKDAHIVVAVEGVGWTHKDHIPLLVAQTIVGSWDRLLGNGSHLSSKLAQEVSSLNLASAFTSFNTTYTDTGLFGLYMMSHNRGDMIKLCEVTLNTWRNVCNTATDADVFRAKNQLKTSLLFSLDSSPNVAEEIGRHMLTYGRRLSPFELDRMIDSVDANAVRDVAAKYLYDADPAVVAIGPVEAWPDYVVLRGNMS